MRRGLLAAVALTGLAEALYSVPLSWSILEETGSPLAVGLAEALYSAPWVLLAPAAGRAVDALLHPRASAVGVLASSAILALSTLSRDPTVRLAAALALSAAGMLYWYGEEASAPEAGPTQRTLSAVYLAGAVSYSVGASASGLVSELAGSEVCLLTAAAVFLASLPAVASLPPRPASDRGGRRAPLDPAVRRLVAVGAVGNLAFSAGRAVWLPALGGPSAYGLTLAAASLGGAAALALGLAVGLGRRAGVAVSVLFSLEGLASAAVPSLGPAAGAAVGLTGHLASLAFRTLLQERTPGEARAGTLSAVDSVLMSTYAVGCLVGGLAAEEAPPPQVVLASGLLAALAALSGLAFEEVRGASY